MTISSSLNAGVSGLNANATKLATISDNIANSATYGYKRAEADFFNQVIGGPGKYSAGGVRTTTTRMIDQSAPLISTSNPTDISIGGRGFLPTTTLAAVNAENNELPFRLMTTGSFRPDADGLLVNEAGMVLMGWPANVDGTMPVFSRDTASGLEPIQVTLNQFAGDPTDQINMAVNLPAADTLAGASGESLDLSVEYFGNIGTSESLNISFVPTVPASGSSNEWTMTIRDSASNDAVIGEYVLTFDDTRGSGGTLASVTTVSGGTYDPLSGNVDLTVAGGPMSFSIGQLGDPTGMTQLSYSFAPVSITKNGSPVGNLTSLEIDPNGYLHAVYDVGFSRKIYQIPLIDVPNINGLISHNNQTYEVSNESGDFFLWDAGDGPTGEVIGFSREESATDVAHELTQLIQTQRAYSSNAKVIQTVDEMLQETTNIKR